MSREHMRQQLELAQKAINTMTITDLETVLDRIHDARRGYRTGHDPAGHHPTPGHEHDCACENCTPPPGYSDRTGELAISGRDEAEAEAREVRRALISAWRAAMVLANYRQRYVERAAVVQWCASCKRDKGREVRAAAGRYSDACRFCGESRSRNDGQDPPLAIVRAWHRGGMGAITDQLITANPQDNGKRWKRPKGKRNA